MFKTISKGHSFLDFSTINKRVREADNTKLGGKTGESGPESERMGDGTENKQIDSHNTTYALVNYESKTEDNHKEETSNAMSMSRDKMEWTDYLEVLIVLGLAIYAINKIRKMMAKKRKKKEELRQKEMINQLQSGISTITAPSTNNFTPIHQPLSQTRLMIENAGEGKSNTRGSTFRIYEPP